MSNVTPLRNADLEYYDSDEFFMERAAGPLMITPKLAKIWLQRNSVNRKLRWHIVEVYARQMRNGKFDATSTSIGFSEDGRLTNGQHRLNAIVRAGVPVEQMVSRGLSMNSMAGEDRPIGRTFGDILGMKGVQNAKGIGAMVRAWTLYKAGRLKQYTQHNKAEVLIGADELWDAYLAMINEEGLSPEVVQESFKTARSVRDLCNSQAVFAFFCCMCIHEAKTQYGDTQIAEDFLDRIRTGVAHKENDPVLALRSRLMRIRISKEKIGMTAILAYCIKAWDKHRSGKPASNLVWKTGEDFPR